MTMDREHLVLLLDKLTAWKPESRSFHTDRQLADEMLLACGWRVCPDPEFEGGCRWEFGTNPRYCTGETNRPHPVNSVDAALGQIPYGWALGKLYDYVQDSVVPGRVKVIATYAEVSNNVFTGRGNSEERSVAICIAIVRALIEADAMERYP